MTTTVTMETEFEALLGDAATEDNPDPIWKTKAADV